MVTLRRMRQLLCALVLVSGCSTAPPQVEATCAGGAGGYVDCDLEASPGYIDVPPGLSCGAVSIECVEGAPRLVIGEGAVSLDASCGSGAARCEDGSAVVCYLNPERGGPYDPCAPCSDENAAERWPGLCD